jgi:hypothetical protein
MAEIRSIQELTDSLLPRMVAARHWHDASFINLPMVYPSGGFVTVRLTQAAGGIKVSDAGFAYQEADMLGAGRSFANTAKPIAEYYDVQVGSRSVFADVTPAEVERAIFDVSAASHLIAERIVSRAVEADEATVSDVLKSRLDHLFAKVDYDEQVTGASSTEWEVSAIARIDGRHAVFQAVANHPSSIYKTSTAFHDIAALDDAPLLVSVVSSKAEFGKSYNILAQAGRVIEVAQPDEVYLRAAA